MDRLNNSKMVNIYEKWLQIRRNPSDIKTEWNRYLKNENRIEQISERQLRLNRQEILQDYSRFRLKPDQNSRWSDLL